MKFVQRLWRLIKKKSYFEIKTVCKILQPCPCILSHYAESKEQTIPKYFCLEKLQEEFNIVTEEDIKNCKCFQLLQFTSLGS